MSLLTQVKNTSEQFDGDLEFRRTLAYRTTDFLVHRQTGRWPLSVATDRLGMAAIRCAGLLSKLAQVGFDVSRSGEGHVAEVYPAGSMRVWKLGASGYRADSTIRIRLLKELQATATWLRIGPFAKTLIESCDAFDSLIAALSAYGVRLGFSSGPSAAQIAIAQIEGWVHLPNTELMSLDPAAQQRGY